MSYKSENLTRQLRASRQEAGLSQHALGERSGLTQSHISQIERGIMEPGLSSLIDLARALDLEVMLVPKKLAPTVQNILSTHPSDQSRVDEYQSKEVARFGRLVTKQKQLYGASAELDMIADGLRMLRRLPLGPDELSLLQSQARRLQEHQVGAQSRDVVQEIARAVHKLRNSALHRRDEAPRPAYSLDEDDDDA